MNRDETEPVFAAPWEAKIFAMVVDLHDRGCFTWAEWTGELGEVVAQSNINSQASQYESWLTAIERLLSKKQIIAESELATLRVAWREAASATPHGQPIAIDPKILHGLASKK